MADLSLEELKKETCSSYGGNNCVMHQCMFGCVLQKAIQMSEKGEKGEYAYKGAGYCHKCGYDSNHCKC